jgi:hypothetical protein
VRDVLGRYVRSRFHAILDWMVSDGRPQNLAGGFNGPEHHGRPPRYAR